MSFNSVLFFVFFVLITATHFALPHRFRWALLLAGSVYFYMCWRAEYILLLLFSITVDYFAALRMTATQNPRVKKAWLLASLGSNFGLLFFFKYFNFLNSSTGSLFDHFGWPYQIPNLNVLLPVGVSFYTFQALSYTIDIYRGERAPEKNFGIFALYVTFFPQLVAGPIERAGHLLPQFFEEKKWDFDRVAYGAKRIFWGLFKKVVIADRLALYVDAVYNHPHDYSGGTLLLATYFFAIQIYCDFSGYSDIAVGSARILGFHLMENFRLPYFATSITDFWRRWHISLSTWLRDYLYIPLGGNRKGKGRTYLHLILTMVLGGIWHGANWTFLFWGTYHGALLVLSKLKAGFSERLTKWFGNYASLLKIFRIFLTFHLVCLGWIFFRAHSISEAFYILQRILLDPAWFSLAPKRGQILLILFLFLIQWIQRRVPVIDLLKRQPLLLRWAFYYTLLFVIILYGIEIEMPFIYFQF